MKYLIYGMAILILSGCAELLTGVQPKDPYPARVITASPQVEVVKPKLTLEQARQQYEAERNLTTIQNPFESSNSKTIYQESKPSVVYSQRSTAIPKTTSKSVIPVKSGNFKCGSLPTYCKNMTSCEQAKAALKCGNSRLDRDGDGIPCENVCGGG